MTMQTKDGLVVGLILPAEKQEVPATPEKPIEPVAEKRKGRKPKAK